VSPARHLPVTALHNDEVKRVLLTGMSGTGKSSIAVELSARGYKAVDTDYGDWKHLVDLPANTAPTGVAGRKDLLWREDLVDQLLSTEDSDVLFLVGTVPNQSKFYRRFDHIVLLTAPASVIRQRLTTRTNNPYGKAPGELERVLELKRTIEPVLRRAATIEIDTSASLNSVVDEVIRRVSNS
jgi:shikimate kinase